MQAEGGRHEGGVALTPELARLDGAPVVALGGRRARLELAPRRPRRALLAKVEAGLANRAAGAVVAAAPGAALAVRTLVGIGVWWLAERAARDVRTWTDERARPRDHVPPALGLRRDEATWTGSDR